MTTIKLKTPISWYDHETDTETEVLEFEAFSAKLDLPHRVVRVALVGAPLLILPANQVAAETLDQLPLTEA